MNQWPDLSYKQATSLIITADAVMASGSIKTGKVKRSLCLTRRCEDCGVQFKSKNFKYCPLCYMKNHHARPSIIVSPHQDKKRHWHFTVGYAFIGLGVCALVFTILTEYIL